ncbi:vesicle transport through interaction with t-SNAREs homolog 1A [Diabrotica virgifera virgifera]|uniref:Vesicle transport through interaction with t-SNAREs homolog 1A n=1 Tax=Diabrotica virgifera virgifera TaxID=50390 RepID=A0A6P7FRB9_DIAVI|nr:vesicle transport through interaction with t-SNAREs homolog 1A [Diabrotica virgifera virgifera]
MVSLFENYEQQYSVLTADITAQVGLLTASATKDRRQLISNIEKHLEEAQELLELMDLEAMELEQSKKQRCRTKCDCYRAELKRLTLDYIKARSVKQGILYDSSEDLNDIRISTDQKQRLLDNSEKLERTSKKLEEGYRVIVETEEIGIDVLKNLGEQKESIQRSRQRLREADEELGRSGRLMNSMIMRTLQQKVVMYTICACFVVAICLGVYLGVRRS